MKWILALSCICASYLTIAQHAIITAGSDTIFCAITDITVRGVHFDYESMPRIIALAKVKSVFWQGEWKSQSTVNEIAIRNQEGVETLEEPIIAVQWENSRQGQAGYHIHRAGSAGLLQLGGGFGLFGIGALAENNSPVQITAFIMAGILVIATEIIQYVQLQKAGKALNGYK